MRSNRVISAVAIVGLTVLSTNAPALEPPINPSMAVHPIDGPVDAGDHRGVRTVSNACPATNVGVLSDGSTIVGSTIGSADDFVAGCGSNAGGQDNIFEFTVEPGGVWTFESCTAPGCWDTTLEIREETGGGCPGDFPRCDGDGGGCGVCYYESALSTLLKPGTTYYLIVDGWSSFEYGDFTITASLCTSDVDGDEVCDGPDNCPDDSNPGQEDGDGDGVGDACDPCPLDNPDDTDGDGVCDSEDTCPGGDDNVDVNSNGIPDACEIESPVLAGPPHHILKNRYISIDPRGAGKTNPAAHHIRVEVDRTLVNGLNGTGPWWASDPVNGGGLSPAVCISVVTTKKPATEPDWSGCPVLHLTGCPIVPTTTYTISAETAGKYSADVLFNTQAKPGLKWHGDCVGFFTGTEWTAPNFNTNIDDAVAAIKTFQNPSTTPGCGTPPCNATHVSVTDMEPNLPGGPQINSVVNIADVFSIILGFQGVPYPGPDLTQCQ